VGITARSAAVRERLRHCVFFFLSFSTAYFKQSKRFANNNQPAQFEGPVIIILALNSLAVVEGPLPAAAAAAADVCAMHVWNSNLLSGSSKSV
jgi:hypothetical protein